MAHFRRQSPALRALPKLRMGAVLGVGVCWSSFLFPGNSFATAAGLSAMLIAVLCTFAWIIIQYTRLGGGANLWVSITTGERILACVTMAWGLAVLYFQPDEWYLILLPPVGWGFLIYDGWRQHKERMDSFNDISDL